MPYPVVVLPWLKVDGLTLFPFIFIRQKELKGDHLLMRHEHIHLKQQLELLILPFYVLYLCNYLFNLWKYKQHDIAYRHIIFEQEAYRHEHDKHYLSARPLWAWLYPLKR